MIIKRETTVLKDVSLNDAIFHLMNLRDNITDTGDDNVCCRITMIVETYDDEESHDD